MPGEKMQDPKFEKRRNKSAGVDRKDRRQLRFTLPHRSIIVASRTGFALELRVSDLRISHFEFCVKCFCI
jgi:hypothetical protein